MSGKDQNKEYRNFSKNLILWQKEFGRHNLPWQKQTNPYRVWISEIMLQQTQVKTVLPFFEKFMKKYPDIKALSKSKIEDVFELWTGLGYYRRAENIYKSSQIIRNKHNLIFPSTFEEIINLPGIGRSTAGAILSLAFNKRYAILDGNVKRVLERYFAIKAEKNIDKELWEFSENLLPKDKNNIYSQAIMDLGATICTKKTPVCEKCPVSLDCKSLKFDLTNVIPIKRKKIIKKEKDLNYLLVVKNKNLVLMQKNPSKGIWANLWTFLNFKTRDDCKKYLKKINLTPNIYNYASIQHNLTHMKLNINIYRIDVKNYPISEEFYWKNIYDNIATAKPFVEIIKKLTEELENENSPLFKVKKGT